ncbi:MAG: VWA domain-containing protein [Myxococcota bacterium]
MQAAPADNAVAPQDTTTQVAVAEEPADPNRPWIAAATASEYMLIGQSEQTFGVWVDVPKGAGGHVPTALSLAIDTSGSMRGEKIIHARDAARRLIEELEDGDIVSLVTFSGQAHLLRSPTVIDDHRRRDLLNLVEELTAEGGTAMHDGLKVAEGQLWQTPDTHLVRRMVVISDGKATVGVTARHTLGNVAEVGLQKSIQVTALGVGVDYDELTLNELAVRSSGRLYHVEESSELPAIVEEEMALLESTAAADVAVELVAAPGVHIVGTDIAHATRQGGGLAVPLGTMFGGQQRELLVRARVDDNAVEGSKVLASVRLHFRDPAEGGVARVQEAVLRATVTDDPGLVAEHTNSRTQTLIAVREVSDWTQQASQELNRGDLDAADVQLARAESRMREQERRATTKADKARARSSAAKIAQQRSSVKKAKAKPAKARKKASRKLSLDANADAMSAFGY